MALFGAAQPALDPGKNILPWVSYKPFFHLEKNNLNGNNISAMCRLCLPMKKMIGASTRSCSNLKKHITKVHPSQLSKLELVGSGNRRPKRQMGDSDPDEPDDRPTQKEKRQATLTEFQNGRPVSQERFEKLLTNFVVKGLHPFSIVESDEFREMIKGIAPDKKVISRTTLMSRINESAAAQVSLLIETIAKIDYVATTADSWKAFNRSYVGLTIHWLDPATLARKSTVLACRRVVGSQTHDVLANLLSSINNEFGIQNKIVSTTTDNGANFVKAFRVYGQPEAEDDDDQQFIAIADILNKDPNDEAGPILPNHERCSAHTMNLIATKDTEAAAADNAIYKRKSRSTLALCQGLWNKQGSSSLHADTVKGKLGIYLVTPNATRWNSLFDSLSCLNKMILEKADLLDQTVDLLGLPRFRDNDRLFIAEYCKVMKPVATALDQLQGEKTAYMGVLLPTLHSLRRRLVTLKENRHLEICDPLVTSLINGIDIRFADQWFRKDLVIASTLHPHFHFKWIMDVRKEEIARRWLEELVTNATPVNEEEEATDSTDDDGAFDFRAPAVVVPSRTTELERYLTTPISDFSKIAEFPIIRKLFIKHNTAIPSSAGVERIFSTGGLIFSNRRGCMSDTNFENSLRLKIGIRDH